LDDNAQRIRGLELIEYFRVNKIVRMGAMTLQDAQPALIIGPIPFELLPLLHANGEHP